LRRYTAHVVAEETVNADIEDAANRAFRTLLGYISGQNTSAQKLEMTAPVIQEQDVQRSQKLAMTAPVEQTELAQGEHRIAFVLPASVTPDTAPVPTNPQVHVHAVPERFTAAARFSGRWSESAFRSHLAELASGIEDAGLTPTGEPRYARFDPPYKPWFLRRNEVAQDVIRDDDA
ncbi:MAG: heme-binding protein, partial [Humibacillus sp.]|nr:heme-binding protein [Humibacillus sp.]